MDNDRMDHWQIGKKYNEVLQRLARVEEEVERRRGQDLHVIKADRMVWQNHHVGLAAAERGFNAHNFHSFFHELPPGASEGAYHMHGEAVKFYLKGKGREIIGDKEYEVEEGDVMLVPGQTWHGTQNPSADPVIFFAVAHSDAGTPLMRHPIFRTRGDLEDQRLKQVEKERLADADYAKLGSWELSLVKHYLLHDLGSLEVELDRRRGEERHLMRKGELQWGDLAQELGLDTPGKPYRFAKAVFPELGFKAYNFIAYFVEVPPGKTEGVYVTQGETVKLYLEGKGKETVGEKEYDVEKGDVAFVPANTWQATKNPYDKPLRFYAVTHGRGIPAVSPVLYRARGEARGL